MKNALVPALILLALCLAVPAQALFDITYSIGEDTIYPDESTSYIVTINNQEPTEDLYTIFSIDPSWILTITPSSVKVPGQGSATFNLSIQPKRDIQPGPYLVPIRFKSVNTVSSDEMTFFIYIKSYGGNEFEYRPSIALTVNIPEQIDPRQRTSMEIAMRNRNGLTIPTLTIAVTSDIFQKEYVTSLGPVEEKSTDILLDIDPLVEPGVYPIKVELLRGNESISEVTKNIVILDYSKLVEDAYTVKELFKSTEYITIKNIGNDRKKGDIVREKNFFARIFTSSEPAGSLKDIEGRNAYVWSIDLNPQGETKIVVVENYRFLATIILLLILIVAGYYLFRSPIVALKKAKLFGTKEEGASFIKIKIFMRNRTKKPVYNINIIDKIPSLAKIVEDEDVLGTLKPSKIIRNDRAGTIVRWDVEKLDPYEERIITYKIRTHLRIMGAIRLAPAKIKFDTGLGKERATYSNMVEISTEMIREKADISEDVKRLKGKQALK